MTPSQIVTADLKKRGVDPKRELIQLEKAVKIAHAIVLQEDNTIMVLLPLSKDSAEIKMYSTDTPLSIMSAVSVFIKKLKNSDIKKIYFNATSQQNVATMQKLGVQVANSDKKGYNAMAIL